MEKREQLAKWLEELESENQLLKFNALSHLLDDCIDKIQHLSEIKLTYQKQIREMQLDALDRFKEAQLFNFYEKYKSYIEDPTLKAPKEMMVELEVTERIDKFGCYRFNGLEVTKLDCVTCSRRNACWGRGEQE